MTFKNVLDITQRGNNPFIAIVESQTEEQKQRYRERNISGDL